MQQLILYALTSQMFVKVYDGDNKEKCTQQNILLKQSSVLIILLPTYIMAMLMSAWNMFLALNYL